MTDEFRARVVELYALRIDRANREIDEARTIYQAEDATYKEKMEASQVSTTSAVALNVYNADVFALGIGDEVRDRLVVLTHNHLAAQQR